MENISTKRTTCLIASFSNGFADDWYMAVKECFKPQLDIVLTERKKNSIAYVEWTQGPYFCFAEGNMLYDSKKGYDCWDAGMKHVNLACQVVESKPNTPLKKTNSKTGKSEFTLLEGFVRFVLYTPNNERTQMVATVGHQLTQNQFVDFLKYGTI